MKKFGKILAFLFVLILLSIAGLMLLGTTRLNAKVAVAPETLVIVDDAETVAEGERLAAIYQCAECHAEGLGGSEFINSSVFMKLSAPNLTGGAGGLGSMLSAADWEHAIRHGTGHDGRLLVIMPSNVYAVLTDADVAAMIAYFRQLPPVNSQQPGRQFGPIGRIVAGLNADELLSARTIDHAAPHRASFESDETAALGRYLSESCTACHRADLTGGPMDFGPELMAPNLTPDQSTGLGGWSLDDFRNLIREGKRPDGSTVADAMPWRGYAHFSDAEIAALWDYLLSLPPVRHEGA